MDSLAKLTYTNFDDVKDGFIKDQALQNMHQDLRFVIGLTPPDSWERLKKQAEVVEYNLRSLPGLTAAKTVQSKAVCQLEEEVDAFQYRNSNNRG